jgi:PAS domain S-box-containing protein
MPGLIQSRVTGLRPRALLPIAASLTLMLLICAAAAYFGVSGQRHAAQAAHEDRIETIAATLRADLLAADSNFLFYLATGRAAYLQTYQFQAGAIAAALGQLDTVLDRTDIRFTAAHALHAQVTEKLGAMHQALTLAQGGQLEAARAQVNSAADQQRQDAIETSLASLRSHIGAARDTAADSQARSIALMMVAIAAAAGGAILMAALAARELQRHLRLLQKRENQLDRLVASLEDRVARRTRDLAQTNQRFRIALDSSRVTVFAQRRDLTYSWVSQGFRDITADQIVGRTDSDFLPPEAVAQLNTLKSGVLETGVPAAAEVRIDFPPSTIWYDLHIVPSFAPDGGIDGIIGGAVDISERKHYESHIRTLMREVTHRSKNLLAVVQALMRQTAAHASTIGDFSERFAARLDSLAGAYDLLIKDDWRGTTIDELVRSQLARFSAQDSQIRLAGPPVRLPPDATQNIGMALHELATNAARYGALSVATGRLSVTWQIEDGDNEQPACRIWWQETGGPLVAPPDHHGFGQTVIERTVARAVGGRVTLAYHPQGLEWMLVFPITE